LQHPPELEEHRRQGTRQQQEGYTQDNKADFKHRMHPRINR